MSDPRETLAHIREQADAATEGPWEADGAGEVSQHWSRPEPWETVVGTDVACMSYCYGGSAKGVERDEDAEFIAAARTNVPRLVDALEAALNIHRDGGESQGYTDDGHYGTMPHCCTTCGEFGEYGVPWPCPTVTAITQALEGETNE